MDAGFSSSTGDPNSLLTGIFMTHTCATCRERDYNLYRMRDIFVLLLSISLLIVTMLRWMMESNCYFETSHGVKLDDAM